MPLEMTRYGTVHYKGINYRRKRKTRQIQINLPTDYKMYLFILLLIHFLGSVCAEMHSYGN